MRDYLLAFLRGLLGLEPAPLKPSPTFDFSISVAQTPYPHRQAVLYENNILRAWVVKSHPTDRYAIITHIELRNSYRRTIEKALTALHINSVATGGECFRARLFTRAVFLLDTDSIFSPQNVDFVVTPPPLFENYWNAIQRSTK